MKLEELVEAKLAKQPKWIQHLTALKALKGKKAIITSPDGSIHTKSGVHDKSGVYIVKRVDKKKEYLVTVVQPSAMYSNAYCEVIFAEDFEAVVQPLQRDTSNEARAEAEAQRTKKLIKAGTIAVIGSIRSVKAA